MLYPLTLKVADELLALLFRILECLGLSLDPEPDYNGSICGLPQ
jgi:hypothetical protein